VKGTSAKTGADHFARSWKSARDASDLPLGFRFHDLRHTANTLTAATGASTRELMARLGHASSRAAIGYQHATSERDRVIAGLLDSLVTGGEKAAEEARASVVS
jgi:integrase